MKAILLALPLMLMLSCTDKEALFENVPTGTSNVDFQNILTETDDFNILDYLYFYNGGGVAVGDINNDGLPDIYFSGNQVKNKLFLNGGDLVFEDITASAGVAGKSDWNTGAVMGDVNGDGWLDIYVCAVVGLRGLDGYNELYINNGDNTFTESAAKYGLNFDSYSSTAAFLDYDQDGDLDIYLLNHAIHTQESFGHANLRNQRSYETGDKLLRNDGEKFIDVSEEAGIFGGINGYGLGIAVADFNTDGYPDVYVGNDFHEDDYYYLNNGDGTFTERLKEYFAQTTRFSMGNDVADLNHDGLPDIISLDMLPEDEQVLKSSEGDEDVNILKLRTQRYGYHYQFTRNMLQINQGDAFVETALLDGVAATDWSWSALFADYNQDGEQDLFISNGVPKRPNDLDYIRFVSNEQIKDKIDATKLVDQRALDMMPSGEVRNYIFKGTGLGFEDKSVDWIPNEAFFSTATALGDLDGDGDLDIVITNNNSGVSIYENTTNESASYLKVKLSLPPPNMFGIGSKVYSYHKGNLQYKELYTVRGFQASSEPVLHFGYGDATQVDSLRIIWPDGTSQIRKDIAVNQTLTILPEDNKPYNISSNPSAIGLFEPVEGNLGIDFKHQEDRYIDFDRQKLMPYQISDRGPATAIGDIDGDGKADLFFGGSKFIPSRFYLQKEGGFIATEIPGIQNDSIKEDVAAAIADFSGDGVNDLLVGSGGADFYNQMKPLLDSYYVQSDTSFSGGPLPEFFENASVIKPNDYDRDGDMDVFIGNHAVSNDFGAIPMSMLLNNENGEFSVVDNPALQQAGMVTDAVWVDYTNDGQDDLILVGEWMSPKFFVNEDGNLKEEDVLASKLNGLWQAVAPFDIDQDGDLDFVLGNWGENSKFTASDSYPLKMYYGDLDTNGSTETIVAAEKGEQYFPLEGLDGLAGQMVGLRKTYTNYRDFAGQTVDQIIDANKLKVTAVYEVNVLKSGYLKNEGGRFTFYAFDRKLQISPITAFANFDFDGDGTEEVLVGGNYFGVKPFHGRFGSFSGALISSEQEFVMGHEIGLDWMNKSIRELNMLTINEEAYLLVTINDDSVQVYKLRK